MHVIKLKNFQSGLKVSTIWSLWRLVFYYFIIIIKELIFSLKGWSKNKKYCRSLLQFPHHIPMMKDYWAYDFNPFQNIHLHIDIGIIGIIIWIKNKTKHFTQARWPQRHIKSFPWVFSGKIYKCILHNTSCLTCIYI